MLNLTHLGSGSLDLAGEAGRRPALLQSDLGRLSSSASRQDNVLTGASLIVVVPVVSLFLLLQRYFIDGLAGAVKG